MAILPIALIYYLWSVYPQPTEQTKFYRDYVLSVRSYDVELWKPYLERLGYKYCGTTLVHREGVVYSRGIMKEPFACYWISKLGSPTFARLYGRTSWDVNGPANFTDFIAGNDLALGGLDIRPAFSQRIPDPGLSYHGSATVKSITIADRILIVSYMPDPGVSPYYEVTSIAFVYDVGSISNLRLPAWFHNVTNRMEQLPAWKAKLYDNMFVQQCGTFELDPSSRKFTISYDVPPTGALCYFIVNVPEGVKIQPKRISVSLKAEPVQVTGEKVFMVWEGPTVMTITQVPFLLPPVPYKAERRDDDRLVRMLLSGKEVTMVMEVGWDKNIVNGFPPWFGGLSKEFIKVDGKEFQQIEVHWQPVEFDASRTLVIPFLFAISAISEVDRIPTVHALITFEYETGKLAKLAVITVSLSFYYTVLACLALLTSPQVVYSMSAAPLPDKISFCLKDTFHKYLWLPNLKVSFAVNENPCTVHVSWADLPQPYLAYTRYNTTYVSKQVEETPP